MEKKEFFSQVDRLDAPALRKLLWILYWRGAAKVRERIEEELEGALEPDRPKKQKTKEPIIGELVLDDVRHFIGLARSGAYIGGSREVSRKERSQWRSTYKKLLDEACQAISEGDCQGTAKLIL